MKFMRRMILLLVVLSIIYGMSLADYKVTTQTDDNFKVIWKEYSVEDKSEFVMKDQLNFFDGLNNSVAILGKSIIDYPMDGWTFFNKSKEFLSNLELPVWANTILEALFFILCYIAAAVVMIISIPVLLYKLSFFEADPSYHLGICAVILGLFIFTKFTESKGSKRPKPQPKPQQVKV